MKTIPTTVLDKIAEHRPHLQTMIDNLDAYPVTARQTEKALADAYLRGTTRLTAVETYKLCSCSAGRGYGQ
jgi:hypothetical protein